LPREEGEVFALHAADRERAAGLLAAATTRLAGLRLAGFELRDHVAHRPDRGLGLGLAGRVNGVADFLAGGCVDGFEEIGWHGWFSAG
jgi:hypothetical protein